MPTKKLNEGWRVAEPSTDHRLVDNELPIRANLRTRQRTARVERRMRREVLHDEVTRAEFARMIGYKYSQLPPQTSDVETEWVHFGVVSRRGGRKSVWGDAHRSGFTVTPSGPLRGHQR